MPLSNSIGMDHVLDYRSVLLEHAAPGASRTLDRKRRRCCQRRASRARALCTGRRGGSASGTAARGKQIEVRCEAQSSGARRRRLAAALARRDVGPSSIPISTRSASRSGQKAAPWPTTAPGPGRSIPRLPARVGARRGPPPPHGEPKGSTGSPIARAGDPRGPASRPARPLRPRCRRRAVSRGGGSRGCRARSRRRLERAEVERAADTLVAWAARPVFGNNPNGG